MFHMYDCLGIKVFPWKLCQSKNGVCDESPPKRWTVADTFAWRLPGSQIHVSSLSHLNLTSIWVLIFTYRLHPGNISPPPRPTNLQIIMCISCMDLVKECERKHKDNYCFIPLSVHWLWKDGFFLYIKRCKNRIQKSLVFSIFVFSK